MLNRFRSVALATIAALGIALGAHLPAGAQTGPQAASGVLNNAAASNAVCTAQSCVSLPIQPLPTQSVCWVQVDGTFAGTLVVEGSLSGAAYTAQANVTVYGGTTTQANITAIGLYQAPCGPLTSVRMSAYTSGSARVTLYAANFQLSGVTPTTLAGTSAVNNSQIAGSNVTTATGLAGQRIYPTNTSGGGCNGVNLSTGTQITKVILAPVTITASEASTQIIALAASKFVHICAFSLSGVTSATGVINILTGTGANCAGTPATLFTYNPPASGFDFNQGNGEMGVLDSLTAGAICVSSGAFVATAGPTLNITYAQY